MPIDRLGTVPDHDYGRTKPQIAPGCCIGCSIAEGGPVILERGQHDVGMCGGRLDGGSHLLSVGQEPGAKVRFEGHAGSALSRPIKRIPRMLTVAFGQNGTGDAGKDPQSRTGKCTVEFARVLRQVVRDGLAPSVGKAALALRGRDRVEPRRSAWAKGSMRCADPCALHEAQHRCGHRVIAKRRQAIDLPVRWRQMPQISGHVEGAAGKALSVKPNARQSEFDQAFPD